MTNELLSGEQLDLVSGGSIAEFQDDKIFLRSLGYDLNRQRITDIYAENGVMYKSNVYDNNEYSIKINGQWCKHPHWAVMGYILARNNYIGFNGKWTDSNYVHSFLKNNFFIDLS